MIVPISKEDFGIRGFARYEVSAPNFQRLEHHMKSSQLTSESNKSSDYKFKLYIIFLVHVFRSNC